MESSGFFHHCLLGAVARLTYQVFIAFFFQQKQQLPDMEFGRRMATERDLEKTDTLRFCNVGMKSFDI